MAVKSLYQFFYYTSIYLNSMNCQEISMDPSKYKTHAYQIQGMVSEIYYVRL
jgi:hypothetical protein